MDSKQVKEIAGLACINLSPAEEQGLQSEIKKIINAFKNINSIDTEGLSPVVNPTPIENHLREDSVLLNPNYSTEDLLKCAPEVTGNLYRVPPVL